METVAWVGALETAIGILYLALVGQRSIAQWLEDRRKPRPPARPDSNADEQIRPVDNTEKASIQPSRPRMLSVQSIGDYIEYVWRDPLEAGLVSAKAVTLGSVLVFGFGSLLLLLSALALEFVVVFNDSKLLDELAQRMAGAGFPSLIIAVFSGLGAFVAVSAFDEMTQYRTRMRERREQEERLRAQRQTAQTKRQRGNAITAVETRTAERPTD